MYLSRGSHSILARCATAVSLVFCLAFGSRLQAQVSAYSEDEVEAAFLYRFATYVQWPVTRDAGEPVTIAVLGAATVANRLESFLPGRVIQGRPVALRRLESAAEISDDEVLFIGPEHNGRLAETIERVGQRPVLIVTHAPDGLDHGAMVNFRIVDQRVRFEISLPAAQGAGLMLSSRLLAAALRVATSGCSVDCRLPRRRQRVAELAPSWAGAPQDRDAAPTA